VGTTVPEEYVIFCGTVANIRLRLVGASLLGGRSSASACPSAPVASSAWLAGRCKNATTLAEHTARRTTRIIPSPE
jgi:hypothetical protein